MLPVYVVSLKEDTEKQKEISSKLNLFNIKFSFIEAIRGSDLNKKFVSSLNFLPISMRKGRTPTNGEIGCSLSHIHIYKKLLHLRQDWAIILEDDVILDENFRDFYFTLCNYIKIEDHLDCRWIYLLGGQDGLYVNKFVALSVWNTKIIGKEKFKRVVKSENFVYRTCCYLIHNSICEKLINLSEAEFFIADEWNYFVNMRICNGLYLSDFVHHPIILDNSAIEKERLLANENSINLKPYKNKINIKYFLKKYLMATEVKKVYYLFKKIVLSSIP